MRRLTVLAWFLLILGSAGWPLIPGLGWAFELKPEHLRYSIDISIFKDAALATISFKNVGPNEYEAEMDGSIQGILSLFTGQRRDRYRSRMVYAEGKLEPLVFVEEVWRRGRLRRKEYRFQHEQGRLELWVTDPQGKTRLKWQTELRQPVYDPISALCNFRLGAFGEIKPGETITVPGIPYPEKEDIIFRIGPVEDGKQKVAFQVRKHTVEDQLGTLHLLFDQHWVPVSAWARLGVLGKVTGHLQEDSAGQSSAAY